MKRTLFLTLTLLMLACPALAETLTVSPDGLSLTDFTLPRLTTLVQPVEEIGKACADLLISLIEGNGPNRQILFDPAFRPGASLRAVR